MVFTSMFALEMLLKLAAFGLFDYLRNPYNIFDSVIVIIRCCPAPSHPSFGPEAEWGGGGLKALTQPLHEVHKLQGNQLHCNTVNKIFKN